MLRRDLIMVLIEEMGKVIAQMITNRNHGAARKNAVLIDTAYRTLKIDSPFLLAASPEEIRCKLNQEDNAGLQRMEIAAKILLEESYLHSDRQDEIREKVKLILEYIQENDTTFSLERVELLNQLSTNQ